MAAAGTQELHRLFALPPATELPPDILGEFQSILRLHSISPQELFYKWESYSIKMGPDETRLDLHTARAFKNDVQDNLEREIRGKTHTRSADKRGPVPATPRNISSNNDVFGMLDGLVPNTPQSASTHPSRRKAALDGRAPVTPSPSGFRTPGPPASSGSNDVKATPFAERANAGQVLETLNAQVICPEPPLAPVAEARIKLTANTDLKKFSYRPMAMHLSEASEVLDDRIDEVSAWVQKDRSLPDTAFGNPAGQSTSEIIAVGRIASDALDAKLNAASVVLETSRRMGAGIRVPLKLDNVPSFEFFPGQIVALRGVNASGEYFSVTEVLALPLLPVAASTPESLATHRERLRGGPDTMEEDTVAPLNILLGAGPFTADDNLDFEPLRAVCEQAANTYADALVLTGPFLDVEHPLIATGDFDLPPEAIADPNTATLTAAFRGLISPPLRRLADAVPGITIILVPSVRDAVSKHVSWPQEPLPRKELGLPKQARLVSNPVTISLNEVMFGISSQDIMSALRQEEVFGARPKTPNLLARLPRHLIEQRHFFPLFPPTGRDRQPKTATDDGLPTGAMLDTSYLKLGEWLNARPDLLISPSALPAFSKVWLPQPGTSKPTNVCEVVESVLVINPGTLSKRKASGTYARLTVHAAAVTDEERKAGQMVGHKLFERARVDIIKI
ncbi:MAG: DNA-directed DNA polymerase alpha subunit pol12 [Thelocarpon superellum]|nr:MAG: DNA-directed DNA polymerase alpha subunit pol12 [Thelocarpon superellum]